MICALILAAGQSRRMGVQKLLLPVAGRPMITGIVDGVLRSPVDQVLVVTGRDADQIKQALAGRAVQFVPNPSPGPEMLGSVRCGLLALPAACTGVLVVLGDQPGLTAAIVSRLVESFLDSGCGIAVPVFGGQRGHPILFAARYREEILKCYDGVGLRGLLQAHPEAVLEVEATGPAVLQDVDRPEDYMNL